MTFLSLIQGRVSPPPHVPHDGYALFEARHWHLLARRDVIALNPGQRLPHALDPPGRSLGASGEIMASEYLPLITVLY